MVSIEGVKFQYDAAGPVRASPTFHVPRETECSRWATAVPANHLLHLLCGLLTPTSGALTVGSKSLHTSTDRELDRWRGTEVGVIFQQAHFVQSLTVRENLALPHQLTIGRIPEDLEAKMDDMRTAWASDTARAHGRMSSAWANSSVHPLPVHCCTSPRWCSPTNPLRPGRRKRRSGDGHPRPRSGRRHLCGRHPRPTFEGPVRGVRHPQPQRP